MASLTSKSDSNTSGSEETQHHYIIHAVFFFSLTTDVNRVSLNPKVPVALGIRGDYGVRVHYLLLQAFCQFSLRRQTMATLKEGDQLQMWEFIRI